MTAQNIGPATIDENSARAAIIAGATALGIEFGSTRIKACLVAADGTTLATGSHDWENQLEAGVWTYSLDAIEQGMQDCYARLVADVEQRYGTAPTTFGALGISAMMHGYLPFAADGTLLTAFRTWRNTSTGAAAAELTDLFGYNIPLRWSVAHYYQAVLDAEAHVGDVAFLTTLAGYVHWRLTGHKVLGVGDASGMFPIDPATRDYDQGLLDRFDGRLAERGVLPSVGSPGAGVRPDADIFGEHLFDTDTPTASSPGALSDAAASFRSLLPRVLVAGQDAGRLTEAGAAWLDPTGTLRPGVPMCPPEGDAGTGMVATNSVVPRTGNVSAGTSIFAMVVLEHPLAAVHHELDLVTTPVGDLVAMVHCNNGASELDAWVQVFGQFAAALGGAQGPGGAGGAPLAGGEHPAVGQTTRDVPGRMPSPDEIFAAFFRAALGADADAGGLLAYNYLAGEPITGLTAGRPAFVRTPDSRLTLANFARAQLYAVFGTLALGMRVLAAEGVGIDAMFAHGGIFRTAGVAQRFLAAAIGAPVTVARTASEGGAWGMAVLAAYLVAAAERPGLTLGTYLTKQVFAAAAMTTLTPDPADVTGFAAYLARFEAGLAVQAAAVASLPVLASEQVPMPDGEARAQE